METNNLMSIKDLCYELLDYFTNNQKRIPTTIHKNIMPKLEKLVALVEELPEDSTADSTGSIINNENEGEEPDSFAKKDALLGNNHAKLANLGLAKGNLASNNFNHSEKRRNLASNFNTKISGIVNTLAIHWQQDLPEKILLARRGIDWLKQDSKQGEIGFLNKMVSLGELISEDKKLKHSSVKTRYSKEEAKKMRDELSHNKEFLSAIYNKNHAKHTSSLARLHQLNSIIAG